DRGLRSLPPAAHRGKLLRAVCHAADEPPAPRASAAANPTAPTAALLIIDTPPPVVPAKNARQRGRFPPLAGTGGRESLPGGVMAEIPPTRASLLVRLRDLRDAAAWREFVELYGPVVYGYLRRQGLQDADASDLSQDVLTAVAGAIGRLEYDPARGAF